MKAVLICPAERPGVSRLAEHGPLVAAPLLGRSPIELWIEALAARGAKQVTVLAHDRPSQLRNLVGDGRRWGVQLEVVPTPREFNAEEARTRYAPGDAACEVVVLDTLPDQPELPLFDSYGAWFAAARAWMPRALTPARIGVREIQPGVWVGLRAEVDPRARLVAPCWIGDYCRIGADTHVGPGAILDNRVVVDDGAQVSESIVGPDTYVGKFVSVNRSLADGAQLINWHMNSCVEVPDAFLLGPLVAQESLAAKPSLLGRVSAAAAMFATSPFAVAAIAWSMVRGESPWHLRLGLRSQRHTRRLTHATFAYYELTCARSWLRRWPQFWSVVRGDLTWIGNRPLRPTEALMLGNDFERLWLAAPVGLISLADARGCTEGIGDEACAHASYFAVHSSRPLHWYIFSRAVLRAALVWPIRSHRRKDATVPLEQLVPKQEI